MMRLQRFFHSKPVLRKIDEKKQSLKFFNRPSSALVYPSIGILHLLMTLPPLGEAQGKVVPQLVQTNSKKHCNKVVSPPVGRVWGNATSPNAETNIFTMSSS